MPADAGIDLSCNRLDRGIGRWASFRWVTNGEKNVKRAVQIDLPALDLLRSRLSPG
jgi:hypothetical protein